MIAGGGAPEIELSLRLTQHATTLTGMEQYCFREYAQALEVIPFTLSENAGLNPIATVTELRNKHAKGEIAAGINVRKVRSLRSHNCFCCIVGLYTLVVFMYMTILYFVMILLSKRIKST